MMSRGHILGVLALVACSLHALQAHAQAAPGLRREVPDVYVLKYGITDAPTRFGPRMKSHVNISKSFTTTDTMCVFRNSLGQLRIFQWRTACPELKPGMVLPLFGVVGRVQHDGTNLTFTPLTQSALPAGATHVGTSFPMYLGARHGDFTLKHIGTDDSGKPFAEVTQTRPGTSSFEHPRLFVGSVWNVEYHDTFTHLRVEQIVPANDEQQIVGWMALRPVGDGIEPRPGDPLQVDIPEVLTVSHNHNFELLRATSGLSQAAFLGVRLSLGDGEPHLQILAGLSRRGLFSRSESCPTLYPHCRVGMVLPLCGGVGRVESNGPEGTRFKMLTGDDAPAGITGASSDYPLILGISAGDLRIDRIGLDAEGVLTTDLTHSKPRLVREKFTGLKLDSSFVLRDDDTVTEYRVTELVPPNTEGHVVGWIKLRPIGGGIRERESGE